MGRNEADTRLELIGPRLADAGWGPDEIEAEYPYKRGRIRLVGEETIRDQAQFIDYALRAGENSLMIAALEAKDEDHSPGAGLQQAIAYATDLGLPFAFSSNGHGFVEQDLMTGKVRELADMPSPAELLERYAAGGTMRGPEVENRHGEVVQNPLITPAHVPPGGIRLRYYQERAVASVIEEILAGKHRALLALATGTGKTFIAFTLAWKLIQSGYFKRALFLADRVTLAGQAYNDFGAFGDARKVVEGGEAPLKRDIHFSLYQTLYQPTNSGRLFEQYPPDFFDLVIVDEAHRSGYGDWRAILDHFPEAFQLGMTATPKRTDSIDTFEFFASENKDAEGQPQAIYEYSLGQGIDDGFLATYRVFKVKTNIDAHGLHIGQQVALGAELIVPAGEEPQATYGLSEFEKEIVVPDRTKLLCEDLASKIRSWGINEKTMVFCVTMAHAEQVRQQLQTLLGPEAGKNLYAVRIVSEERDGQKLLEAFQQSDSHEPVLATTVDLLTTGVNVPSVRNIVFMKPVGSVTVFKQILGRGSRLDELTGKEFFRIVDYTDATRLFDSWDVPPAPKDAPEIEEGEGAIHGRVVAKETGEVIAAAAVSIRAGRLELSQLETDKDGYFEASGLPLAPLTLIVTAKGFVRRQVRSTPSASGGDALVIEMKTPSEAGNKIVISGVEVTIAEEIELTLGGGDGQQLSVTQYRDYAGEQVRTEAGDTLALAELWRDPAKRQALRKQLRDKQVDPAILGVLMNRADADEFDLLANVAFGERIRTREERARQLEHNDEAFLAKFTEEQRRIVEELLDKYRLAGVEEIATAEVFKLPPFIDEFGGVPGLAALFGGAAGVAALLRELQGHIYPVEGAAA